MLQRHMVLSKQRAYVSEVQFTDKTNHWFMCFDKAAFSIWSQFQTKREVTEILVLSGKTAVFKSSPMTLETWRHGAFNYLAQININTKPWSYWSYCNQTELMCSLNWSPITPVIRSRSVGAWAASRRQQQWGWKADMWKTLTVEQWLSLGPE